MLNQGRKYQALIFSIYMWGVLLACIMSLLVLKIGVPGAFSTSFIILTGTIPAYLGSNVYQKGNEIKMSAKKEAE